MNGLADVRIEDWNRLQHEVARLRVLVILSLLAVVALAAVSLLRKPEAPAKPDAIIRTQGLVITDAQGHDRILIGAPVPASKDRTRKDDASDGIIFLGKTGADRLAIGQMPAPVIGGQTLKRIGDGDNYGLALFDKKGNERGGMAFLGMGRVVIGLDRAAPLSDAIGLMVDDRDGFAGMIMNYADGKVQAPALELGTTANEVHMQFYGKDNLPHAQLNFDGKGKPAWQFDDAASAAKAAKAAPTTAN
jgi:hypothetical protein